MRKYCKNLIFIIALCFAISLSLIGGNVLPALAVTGSVNLDFDSLPTGTFEQHQQDGFYINYIGFGDLPEIGDVAGNHVLKDSALNVYGAEVCIGSVDGGNFYFNSLDYNNLFNNNGSYCIHVWAFPFPYDGATAKHIVLTPTSSSYSTLTSTALGVDGIELCQLRVNNVSGNADYSVDNIRLTSVAKTVNIDIKPGGDPNSINLKSKGVVPVAILGSTEFDVCQINPETVKFTKSEASPVKWGEPEDVNCDGILDLVLHFDTETLGLAVGDEEATLTGETLDGISFTGTDYIRIISKNVK